MYIQSLNKEKYIAQSQLKKETDELRKSENSQKADLKKDEATHLKNLEEQQAI
jgi:hypothetical protein